MPRRAAEQHSPDNRLAAVADDDQPAIMFARVLDQRGTDVRGFNELKQRRTEGATQRW